MLSYDRLMNEIKTYLASYQKKKKDDVYFIST